MIKMPGQSGWRQTNRSDVLGSLWSSWNLDLTDNLGVTRISPRTLLINDDTANMGVPAAFEFFDGQWWAVCGTHVFESSGETDDAFTADNSTGSPTDCNSDESDLELFNGKLYLTSTDIVLYKSSAAGDWTEVTGALSTGFPHLLQQFGVRLYVTEAGYKVWSINTSDSLATSSTNTIDLSVYGGSLKNTISCMKATTDFIWIGTLNRQRGGKGGRVYYWDGAQTTPNGFIELDSAGPVAMIIKDNTPHILDQNGALLRYNGGTFVEIARLPYNRNKFLGQPYDVDHTDRFCHPNGIAIIDDKINILVRNEYRDNTTSVSENLPSGVWELLEHGNDTYSLYHKLSLSYHAFSAGSVTDYGQFILPRVGALAHAKDDNTAAGADGSMLIGAQYYSDATNTAEGIWINNIAENKQKFGYLVTTKIFSSQITDVWQKLFIRLKKLLASTDMVIVKYRTEDVSPTEATITWTSATTCTTTTNVSAFENFEMEVLNGKGAGKCSKITDVSESEGTYTITLQESFTGATSGTAIARFQYWIEAAKFTSQNEQVFSAPIMTTSPWIQLKVAVQATGVDEINDMILTSETMTPAK